jgi:hypothetical protein
MSYHISLLKNISENLRSMLYQLMPCHFSSLINNSKNLIKSLHATSHFFIEK